MRELLNEFINLDHGTQVASQVWNLPGDRSLAANGRELVTVPGRYGADPETNVDYLTMAIGFADAEPVAWETTTVATIRALCGPCEMPVCQRCHGTGTQGDGCGCEWCDGDGKGWWLAAEPYGLVCGVLVCMPRLGHILTVAEAMGEPEVSLGLVPHEWGNPPLQLQIRAGGMRACLMGCNAEMCHQSARWPLEVPK